MTGNKNNQAQAMSSSLEKLDVNDKRMDTLFARLGVMYGHVWWSAYKTDRLIDFAKKEWSEGLKRFDSPTLTEALYYFREENDYPPTLPLFIQRCKAIMKRKEELKPLSQPEHMTNRETAIKHIEKLYELLRR
jgi:hypothetical protein